MSEDKSKKIELKSDEKANEKVEEKSELSEEDKQLQEELNMLVERLQGAKTEFYITALTAMRDLIRASTTSMTSVPKPLKFMRQHYDTMKEVYKKMPDQCSRQTCANIISMLATIMGGMECLFYSLLCDQADQIGEWGHEYICHLSGQVASNWYETCDNFRGRLIDLVKQIVKYYMTQNAEVEACDLLIEIERLDILEDYVDRSAYDRVCLYLQGCVPYVPDPENVNLLKTALKLSMKFEQYPQAMRLAMMLNDMSLIKDILTTCKDNSIKKQLAFMLARQQICFEFQESSNHNDELVEIMSNARLNNYFLKLARELDIMKPKAPDDVYKSELMNLRTPGKRWLFDLPQENLAASFVFGFVNAGFGQNKLILEEGDRWLYKHEELGRLSATASIGLMLLWDVDGGLKPIEKLISLEQDYITSGALLAYGIVNCGVRNKLDPALALLSDYVRHINTTVRIGAILGLGLAYAGSNRGAALELIGTVFSGENKNDANAEVMAVAALALGMISVGTCNADVTNILLKTITERSEADLKDTYSRFLLLGLGLVYLGRQGEAESVIAALEGLTDPFKTMAKTMVDICAYAGTGNVLKIQHLLHICSDHYETTPDKSEESSSKKSDAKEKEKQEKEKKKDLSSTQALAVLGIALIAMGEEIGAEMAYRSFENVLQYCEPVIRRSVPLALGLISVSNPKLNIMYKLEKLSHDIDAEVAHNAIFAMGMIGAGTNNARLASMLHQLAQHHAKDSNKLFMVRIAQGLTHLGKGTLTISPYHSDRQLMSPVAVAGLLATLVSFLDVKTIVLGRTHYILYSLAIAMQPRLLVTFDEDLNQLYVPVRVGTAVDVVGQAGEPKIITGFQTHTTPVLLATGERAELATEKYYALTPIMEGFVILRKNPN